MFNIFYVVPSSQHSLNFPTSFPYCLVPSQLKYFATLQLNTFFKPLFHWLSWQNDNIVMGSQVYGPFFIFFIYFIFFLLVFFSLQLFFCLQFVLSCVENGKFMSFWWVFLWAVSPLCPTLTLVVIPCLFFLLFLFLFSFGSERGAHAPNEKWKSWKILGKWVELSCVCALFDFWLNSHASKNYKNICAPLTRNGSQKKIKLINNRGSRLFRGVAWTEISWIFVEELLFSICFKENAS